MLSNDQITIVWNEYKDQNEWQRHNETQRARLTGLLLAISGALLAFLPKDLKRNDWPIPVFLIGIGVFGVLAVMKYWERFRYHVRIENAYRKVLDSYFAPNDDQDTSEGQESAQGNLFIKTRMQAVEEHKKGWLPLLKDGYFRQHWLWEGVFVLITLLGVILLGKALSN